MNEIGEKYLPIGSVVILKGGIKRLMIIGSLMSPVGNTKEVYDYAGCLYPEGVLSSKANALFNHNQIKKVYSIGYFDREMKTYLEKLNKLEEDHSGQC